MQLIPCPWCGPRDDAEFHYGAEAHVARPSAPADCSDAEWEAYLYLRRNTKGPFAERWVHTNGCRRWFNVIRDTYTHEVLASYKPGEPKPAIGETDRMQKDA
jgi:heterotetrameric sarcosine oxidase delta subunit